MPNWDGIEDVSHKPLRVWLSRVKETDPWKPLRKVDCWALNESEDATVIVDGGRYTADKENLTLTANFHRAPTQTLSSAVWFVRKDPNSKDKQANLDPIFHDGDTHKIETLYQLAIEAASSFGQGIDEIIKNDDTELEDGSKVKVCKTQGGTVLSLKKQPKGWLQTKLDLQRGYGSYTVAGEDNELLLGPVQHLYFVVHGIGEAIWSREDTSMSSLIQDVDKTRVDIQTRQVEHWRTKCEKHKKENLPQVPPMPHRVEFIPIEWYDRIHDSSTALSKSLKATTLPTIPALRGIANEAVFDVLLYLTPTFCESVLDCVQTQISTQYRKFCDIHPQFLEQGGKCSLIGHSLGSVICWDLLSILKSSSEPSASFGSHVGGRDSSGGVAITSSDENTVDVGYQAYFEENADTAQNGTWGPTLPRPLKETLPFTPENVIFLGSPLGMFLTLRGAHPVFDQFRKTKTEEILKEFQAQEASTEVVVVQEDDTAKASSPKQVELQPEQQKLPELPYASTFTLPVNGGVYNIFHPSDPVAYRIEPLLLPPETDAQDIPPPVHLTVEGEGLRFHVKAQEIGGEIAKAVGESNRNFATLINRAVAALGQHSPTNSTREAGKVHPTGPKIFPLGGNSDRVDFQLQRNVVDPEYLSAVTAHSTYFVNTDVQDFVMSLAAKAARPEPTTSTTETQAMVEKVDII